MTTTPTNAADFGAMHWLWRDATLLALRIECLPDGYLTAVIRCETNVWEDRDLFIPLGAAARVVDVTLHTVEDFSVWNLAATGDPEVIVNWEVTYGETGGVPWARHAIQLHTGAVIEARSRRIEITDVE